MSGRLRRCGSRTRPWWCWWAPRAPASPPGRCARYRAQEVVSSDELRGVVGSGPHDLDASADAFAVLETVVAARLGRGLTTVVDTLGLDAERRRAWVAAARSAGLPAVAVVLSTPAAECRRRNAARERPVPAPALAAQLARAPGVRTELALEGWDLVVELGARAPETGAPPAPDRGARGRPPLLHGRRGRAPGVPLPVGRGSSRLAGRDRAGGRRGGLRRPRADGPPDPDPAGRAGVGADPGAVGDAGRAGRAGDRAAAGHALHPGDVPLRRHHGQGGRHPVAR